MAAEFMLPELGENVETGTVVKMLVSVGEEVREEQPILELETEKALFEVPSSVGGVIKEILVKEGDEVKVGQKILVLNGEVEAIPNASSGKEEKKAMKPEKEKPVEREKAATPQAKKPEKKNDGGRVEFKLPELGENVASGTVVKVLVSEGDLIRKDQGIIELETEKALFEVPSEIGGVVKEVRVKEGDEVKVGQPILIVETEAGIEEEKEARPTEPEVEKKEEKAVTEIKKEAPKEKTAEEARKPAAFEKPMEGRELAPAAPSVRRFAREIGIDINAVPGTGPGGRIAIEDVKAYAKQINQQKAAPRTGFVGIEPEALPDFTKWGEVERKPMSKIRQTTAKHLSFAWATIPHVTQFDKADITELEKLRKQYGKKVEAAGGKLTVTAILLKIVGAALKVFPQFNASIDLANKEIIYKKYYHVGVAVDTEHGLLVPVIRDVDRKNIIELSVELTQMAEKARNRKLALEEMQGGNFSISNLGGIGGTAFTPVVNSPEVAILGISRGQMAPIYLNGNFEPRLMLPLSLSYDHRLIDGADAARFLRWIAEAIEQPFRVVLEG
jgi:pyruvate dehydrogenase E2 component (dihydrolipoamide acetyltransferase)